MLDDTGCGGESMPANAIETHSGRFYDVVAPDWELVDVADIAHSLAMSCRFNGHCETFYSVAQHSVLVSLAVDPEFAWWGLLHDAAEAYLSDVSRPVKVSDEMDGYRNLERVNNLAIMERFGVNYTRECYGSVKKADNDILFTEAHLLMKNASKWNWGEGVGHAKLPEGFELLSLDDCWDWKTAKSNFVRRFLELSLSRNEGAPA